MDWHSVGMVRDLNHTEISCHAHLECLKVHSYPSIAFGAYVKSQKLAIQVVSEGLLSCSPRYKHNGVSMSCADLQRTEGPGEECTV